jgi:hypothetical protein
MKTEHLYLMAGGVVLAAVIYASTRPKGWAGDLAWTVGGTAVDMADGLIGGAVVGVGQLVGIPATNMNECEKAKAEGRTWDASFACPAGDFIKYLWN